MLAQLNETENPLLLHPELEAAPENHFTLLNDGRMVGRTDKGKETIKLLKLNRRDLLLGRLQILKNNAVQINRSMDDYLTDRNESKLEGALGNIFYKITLGLDSDHSFSLSVSRILLW